MAKVGNLLNARTVGIAVIAVSAASTAMASEQRAGASSPPPLSVSPQGNYHDGQTVSVAVGPNGYFTPHSRINVIECADPGGMATNLPKDITTCDGNTIQGSTILVGSDGSFSLTAYPMYLLPSPALGEQANFTPVCNQRSYCVLYVGQNQNDFTAPKVFSAAFLVAGNPGVTASTSTGASGGSGTGSSAATSTGASAPTGASPTVSLGTSPVGTSATLANTGSPADIGWMAAGGMGLLISGAFGRRLLLRGAR